MLVACRECGASVSSEAPYCPRCGVPGPSHKLVVVLTSAGPNKVNTLKAVREVMGLGLQEAVNFVDSLPQVLVAAADEAMATAVRTKFEACGATVEIR